MKYKRIRGKNFIFKDLYQYNWKHSVVLIKYLVLINLIEVFLINIELILKFNNWMIKLSVKWIW
jgi:hypothetical protein